MVFNYNYFFYTNVCHVCKRFGEGVSLKRCGNCTMIAYCSKEHQREHWSQHKDLCNAVHNVFLDNRMSSFLSNKQDLSMEKWAQMKMNFMLLVAMKIPRKLKYYEEQMFKFLKSCAVCHNRNVKELKDCPNCPNASFCTKHKNDTMHDNICYLLKLSFTLDMALILHKRKIPELKVPYRTGHVNLPQNMKYFIKEYIKAQKDPNLSMEEEMMVNAEYLTRPLTFLYATQKLQYFFKEENIIIHIIAANAIEIDGIELWEILLHWLPNTTMISIVLIGPELSPGSIPINLCKNCRYNGRQLAIEMQNMLYENYTTGNSYVKPNFIIGYNAGIHECENFKSEMDTWTYTLRMITKQNCPLILTSYTLSEAEKEQIRLEAILDRDVKCTYFEQNPYSSLRPYRDFESEGVYYQNQYIIIYKNFRAQ
ncbi:uncharacterized protein LOC128894191 [Hylaeus anthracinus]|uniref:uncharacterized protein LOC128894191 n=1 Tax=Hylaeus anthracinus TaxID=313031 RepID=UPI0023B9DBCD|nr:uncharacterized protein LOC128894191 [Hylaeus anthracinus]